jgi:hypothetical protein
MLLATAGHAIYICREWRPVCVVQCSDIHHGIIALYTY